MMNYKVKINEKEIEYGALTTEIFNDEEELEIAKKMVEHNYPELYEKYKDENLIWLLANEINLRERYEALLELLPQKNYSEAGTHPLLIAVAVNHNTFNKVITQDNVRMYINKAKTLEELKNDLKQYFKL